MPLISIITPLHNKGPYIAETIASVQAQTIADWEMIVVENGSKDNGPEVVTEMAQRDTRIQWIKAPQEVCGPCGARNLGIERARGEWLLFLDADDWIEANHLQCLITAGKVARADVAAGGWSECFDGSNAERLLRDGPLMGETSTAVLERSLAFAPWALHAAIIRREWLTWDRHWPLEMEQLSSEDSVFWFRLLHGAKLASVPTYSAIYRKETPSNRDAHRDLILWMEASLRVISLNEAFLQNRSLRPSPTQAAHVMRSLESSWQRCRKANANHETTIVEREVKRWLKLTGAEPSLLLRRVIGIHSFNTLRTIMQKRKD